MFRSRRPTRQPVRVTLYSRPGCHLCEDTRVLLERLPQRYGVVVDQVDISSDPGLLDRYDLRIPVVVFADGTELDAPIQDRQLRSAVKTVARGR